MLIDITQAVGGYLHDVFVGNLDWGILIGYVAQILFAMRFVVQWIASPRCSQAKLICWHAIRPGLHHAIVRSASTS